MDTKALKEYEGVLQSYGRCWVQKKFFDEFYTLFMNSSPEVKPLFKNTDFEKQNTLLRVGLMYFITYAAGDESVRKKIEELGVLHGRSRLNIRSELYPLWVDSLIKAVSKYDIHFNHELEQSWRKVLQKGVDIMVSKY